MRHVPLTLALALLVGLSGCIAGTDDAPSTDDATHHESAEPQDRIVVEQFTGSTGNAVATPLVSVNNGGTYEFPVDRSSPNVTGYVLELTWDAVNPASEDLDLWVRHVGDFALPPSDPSTLPNTLQNNQPTLKATGGSPLRLAFTPDELDADMEYTILVRAATPAGVALEQSFTLNVATFDGVPFDPDHTF